MQESNSVGLRQPLRVRLSFVVVSIIFAAVVGFEPNPIYAQSGLPPEVQADILKTRIVESLQKKDLKTALASMDQYRQLKVPMPPNLVFIEAKAAAAVDDPLRAFASLEEFLKTVSHDSPQYKEALALYTPYQKAQEEASNRKVAALRASGLSAIADLVGHMVPIPAGTFQMGDGTTHTVTLRAFRLSAYDVTFDQYDTFTAATGKPLVKDGGWGRGNRPVIYVSWDDAKAFIAWVNQQTGLKFRLPSEAEWEYAARAGTTTDYYWGSSASHGMANYSEDTCCKGLAQGRDQWVNTAPVGSFPANAWGLYDMSGNVLQWTEDCYHDNYSGAPSDGSAWTAGDCSRRVYRGGSWNYSPTNLRVSTRYGFVHTNRFHDLGFRLAQDL